MDRGNPFSSEQPPPKPADDPTIHMTPSPGGPRGKAKAGSPSMPMEGQIDVHVGASPILAAAAPLLLLLSRLGAIATPPDAESLRDRAAAELRRFEQRVRAGGVEIDLLRPAHFVLCAALDDVALATTWGKEGPWATKPLTLMFHQRVISGEEFFSRLEQFSRTPSVMLPVLELMHLCLSLGMAGKYRLAARGPAELESVREELYALIMRVRPLYEPALSPHPRGEDAPWRPGRLEVPAWVAGAFALAVVVVLFAWTVTSLGALADTLQARVASLPLAKMPTIIRAAPVAQATLPPLRPAAAGTPATTPPVDTGVLVRLRTFLAPEIAQGLVAVIGTEAVPVVRILDRGLFASGSATPDARANGLLARIGEALRIELGPVTIAGYSDNQPIRTVRFPSNTALSLARAESAAALIGQALGQEGRITTEGRGEADPLADNDTEEGRAMNRRIEVILRRQG